MTPTSAASTTTRTDGIVAAVRATPGTRLLAVESPSPGRLYLTVEPAGTLDAVRVLWEGLGARYVISAGLDQRAHGPRPADGSRGPGGPDGFEVLHFFSFDGDHLRCAVRVPLDREAPRLPSITPLIPGAAW